MYFIEKGKRLEDSERNCFSDYIFLTRKQGTNLLSLSIFRRLCTHACNFMILAYYARRKVYFSEVQQTIVIFPKYFILSLEMVNF